MLNSSGTRMEPCGTPHVIADCLDLKLLINTKYFLFSKQDLNHVSKFCALFVKDAYNQEANSDVMMQRNFIRQEVVRIGYTAAIADNPAFIVAREAKSSPIMIFSN